MIANSSQNISRICAAIVAAPHGVQGHVKLKCFLEEPAQLKQYSSFTDGTGRETFRITKVLSQVKDILIVALEGVTDRDKAEKLKGTKLMLSREQLPELSEDFFYHSDLIGLTVKSHKGQPLGKVHALYDFGAGDVLEVQLAQNEMAMVPFRKETAPIINLHEGIVVLSEQGEALLKGGQHGA